MTSEPSQIVPSQWEIDAEGRIFWQGLYVAKIERTPDRDGSVTTAFLVQNVQVQGPTDLAPDVFDSRIVSTSALNVLTEDEWTELQR